jgi:HEAT repeat protein
MTSLHEYLDPLGKDEQALKSATLLRLSRISPQEAGVFAAGWATLPPTLRRSVIAKLVGLAEDNVELDFSAVFRVCLDDSDAQVREQAVRGLWECEERSLIRPFVRLLAEDPSTNVRTAAAVALGQFAQLAQSGKLIAKDGERVREGLLAAIKRPGEHVDVRKRAIEAVAPFDQDDIRGIIRQAHTSPDSKLRQSAIYAMGQNANPEWLPAILAAMESGEAAIRYEAATAAGHLGDESATPHLARLTKDDDPQVQVAAIMALGSVGGPLAKRVLLHCLKSGDETVEEAAETALSGLDFDEDPLGFRLDR